MDASEILEKIGVNKQFVFPLVLAVIGLVFLGYGLIVFLQPKKDTPDILFEGSSTQSESVKISLSPVSQRQIMVDVEGAVEKPGVYRIGEDSRLQDALIAAGGMSDKADRSVVSKTLNLAAKVVDGGKVYIPALGETAALGTETSNMSGGIAGSAVNINSASLSDLDALPGVGQSTAQKIISNRPYASAEELVSKKVVGEKEFEKIKGMISSY
jgi:competence protein ComEA